MSWIDHDIWRQCETINIEIYGANEVLDAVDKSGDFRILKNSFLCQIEEQVNRSKENLDEKKVVISLIIHDIEIRGNQENVWNSVANL